MQKEELIKKLTQWRRSPLSFIESVWGLIPQPIICDKPGCEHLRVECYGEFERGRHLTWQQYLILRAVEKAVRREAPARISIAAGHGLGKSACLAWLNFWFLFTRSNSQVGCTAPSSGQLFDVLLKEIAVWHKRMPELIQDYFVLQSTYLRMAESPDTWFSRFRTGRKENPEALSGLHAEHVMLQVDEASAVADEIYRSAEGALTNADVLVLLISNPTRLEGYFYETHHKDKKHWQTFQFSNIESPIVEPGFSERVTAKYGSDSNEYGFMVLGTFPTADGMIDGWLPLFNEFDIASQVSDLGPWFKPAYMGVDPSGMGRSQTVWVVRDAMKAKIVATEIKSNTKGIAEKTITLAQHYEINPRNVKIDAFGVGHEISQEIALGVQERVHAVNVGDKPMDDRFLNLRSEAFWNFRNWLRSGGKLVKSESWRNQLLTIYYKRTLSGKIQVMPKELMFAKGWKSPDAADAAALTFISDYVQLKHANAGTTGGGREFSSEEVARMTKVY